MALPVSFYIPGVEVVADGGDGHQAPPERLHERPREVGVAPVLLVLQIRSPSDVIECFNKELILIDPIQGGSSARGIGYVDISSV